MKNTWNTPQLTVQGAVEQLTQRPPVDVSSGLPCHSPRPRRGGRR